MKPTEFRVLTDTKLKRIAWLSAGNSDKVFNNLTHLYNEESLRGCFHELDGRKAVGADGMDKAGYGENLNDNLQRLVQRMKSMSYRPGAVRQVLIPKEGKPGSVRPLGIGNFEDKIVQRMTQKVLESVYEPIFLNCSFGFRPGKSCHDAVRALLGYLYGNHVQTIIDVDLANFFGSIDHCEMVKVVEEKIQDKTFIRYLVRMLKAGVLSDGELTVSDEGVPQGSPCSPVLANIFAHYVIDEWFEKAVKTHCLGSVEMFRYADDLVICCQYDRDAKRIRKVLPKRLAKYRLKLNQEKTEMVSFCKQKLRQGEKQESFSFLGFAFYWGRSRRGHFIPKVKTDGRRMRSKLKRVREWAKQVKNRYPLKEIWRRFRVKLAGHTRYYGVSFNSAGIRKFEHSATRILYKWLNRRSQRKSFDWEQFKQFIKLHPLPKARIHHRLF